MQDTRTSPFRPEAVRRRARRDASEAIERLRHPSTLLERLIRRPVPLVLQQTPTECGAASLAMILGWFGRQVSLAECRERCDAARDGVTAEAILEAAGAYGLHGRAFTLEPSRFGHVPLPSIVHWDFDHFLVVERWSTTAVDVVDPAIGRRRLTAEEFEDGFTGVVLAFEPGLDFRHARTTETPAWRVCLDHVLAAPGAGLLAGQVVAVSLLLQLLGLAMPLLTELLIDHILPQGRIDVLPMLGIGMALLCLTQGALTYLRGMALSILQVRLDERIVLGLLEHLLGLPFRFFQARPNGDLLSRVSSGAAVAELLASQTVSIILDGALVVVYLAILFARDPVLGGVVAGLGALQIVVLLVTVRPMHELTQREMLADANVQGQLVELLGGIATIKVSGAESRAWERSATLVSKRLRLSLARCRLNAASEAALTTLRVAAPLALLVLGVGWVLDGSASLGAMLGLVALATACLMPLASLVSTASRIQLAALHFERLADVLRAGPEQPDARALPTPRLTGRVALRQVSFRYGPESPWILRDISLAIEPGQKVALVGPSGCGKTTLALILLGMLEPTEGDVLYDGVPLGSLNRQDVRRQVGVVLQEPCLFSGSIEQNVAFVDPSLSRAHVEAAARLAGIHDEIAMLPMGYDTRLGDGGAGLSGGQRQRLALARALAGRPALLVLDEATSHLDVETERTVERSLAALSCTRIVIAHRLSTVRTADCIVTLDSGRIVERGTHEELSARNGRYAGLARQA